MAIAQHFGGAGGIWDAPPPSPPEFPTPDNPLGLSTLVTLTRTQSFNRSIRSGTRLTLPLRTSGRPLLLINGKPFTLPERELIEVRAQQTLNTSTQRSIVEPELTQVSTLRIPNVNPTN
jgi:hypothetical protein